MEKPRVHCCYCKQAIIKQQTAKVINNARTNLSAHEPTLRAPMVELAATTPAPSEHMDYVSQQPAAGLKFERVHLSFTCEEGLLQKTTLLHIENFFQKFALQ